MALEDFFRPSEELARRLRDYHGINARSRLFTSRRTAKENPVPIDPVQACVQERLYRGFGTIVRNIAMRCRNMDPMPTAKEICFLANMHFRSADPFRSLNPEVLQKLHLKEDHSGLHFLWDTMREFLAWLEGLGGIYNDDPEDPVIARLVLRDSDVYLIVNVEEYWRRYPPHDPFSQQNTAP